MYKRHRGGSGQAAALGMWGTTGAELQSMKALSLCGLNLPIYVVVYETDKYIYTRFWVFFFLYVIKCPVLPPPQAKLAQTRNNCAHQRQRASDNTRQPEKRRVK